MVDEFDVDVVVAGSGVGGLMAAYYAQRSGARVLLLSGSGGASKRISSLNTALGYDSADTAAGLFDDIFKAGGYINAPDVVAAIANRMPIETQHLIDLGVPFARKDGRLLRRQAAGSTQARSVFSEGMIGVDIARKLTGEMAACASPAMTSIRGAIALDLVRDDSGAFSVLGYSPRDKRWLTIRSSAVVLATGGAGQLFGKTTNPRGSRGIGYAMALELGAELVDMEFISYEPFITSAPAGMRLQDLPTTVLRQGAKLRNGKGEEFIDTASAPSKDVICRAMVREVAEGRGTATGSVYFDIRGMDPDVALGYMQITEALKSRNLAFEDGQLEVMPAQHFVMGGVRIDSSASSTVPGVFAVGEVAGGAHGGHRLAAGGGLEVVGGGAIAGEEAAQFALRQSRPHGMPPHAEPRPELLGVGLSTESRRQLTTIQTALQDGCGILRTGNDLDRSVSAIDDVLNQTRGRGDAFIRRSALVALAVAQSALRRAESRGDHFRSDFPTRDDINWLANLRITLDDRSNLRFTREPITRA